MNGAFHFACRLIIVVAVAIACGRIMATQLVIEPSLHRNDTEPPSVAPRVWPKQRPRPMPTFSSNDRSRWATVRSLVDEKTYVIGKRAYPVTLASAVLPLGQFDPLQTTALAHLGYHARIASANNTGIIFEDGWGSVDKVLDPSTQEYYSSKPPLLSTLLAALYWLLQKLTGWTLADDPFAVVRTILIFVNALPFGIYLWQLYRLVETWGKTDWGRLFVLTAGAFATLVGPFLVTLNNHTVGTFSIMFAWVALLHVWQHKSEARDGAPAWYHFVSAGFFAAFAVCNELPALAFAAAVFALLFWWFPSRTLVFALPAGLVLGGAFFATNYAAVGQWRPAYSEFGSPWYEYEGSHWKKPIEGQKKSGIDWAHQHESRATYAMHVLVGHHGLFSLTPIWLLSVAGMLLGLRAATVWERPMPDHSLTVAARSELPWFVQPLGLLLTIVVIGFYLLQSDNYGGWTIGLRWLMWLTPIWLTCLLPIADRLAASPAGRALAYVLLAVSIFSAQYSPWNPWRHPWIYDLMIALGWPEYRA